jgi:hypothetical protein
MMISTDLVVARTVQRRDGVAVGLSFVFVASSDRSLLRQALPAVEGSPAGLFRSVEGSGGSSRGGEKAGKCLKWWRSVRLAESRDEVCAVGLFTRTSADVSAEVCCHLTSLSMEVVISNKNRRVLRLFGFSGN